MVALVALAASLTGLVGGEGPGAGASTPSERRAQTAGDQWVDAWGASFLNTTVNGAVQSVPSFNNQTYRLALVTNLGGTQVRVRLTNRFATNTVKIGSAHVALQGTTTRSRAGPTAR